MYRSTAMVRMLKMEPRKHMQSRESMMSSIFSSKRPREFRCPASLNSSRMFLQSLAEAGDGVKHSQVADEAVHGGVKVPVLDDGYDHQRFWLRLATAMTMNTWLGDLNLSAVCGVWGWSFSARVHDQWLLDCRSAEDLMWNDLEETLLLLLLRYNG